jgi:hypothetical protein
MDEICHARYLTLTDNTAEQTMRPVAIGRKNFLRVGSERGSEAAKTFSDLIQPCKTRAINFQDYLICLLTNLPMASMDSINQPLPNN